MDMRAISVTWTFVPVLSCRLFQAFRELMAAKVNPVGYASLHLELGDCVHQRYRITRCITDRRTAENIMPPPPILGEGIKP